MNSKKRLMGPKFPVGSKWDTHTNFVNYYAMATRPEVFLVVKFEIW